MTVKDSDIILLQEFYDLAQAHIAKGVLATNGIVAIVDNEIMSSVYPITISPLGAIRLMVRKCDLDAARKILNLQS